MKEFPPFRLDTVNQCLWRSGDGGGDERVLLPPKAFAVLRYLVEHAGRLVTQDELLEAVWPDTFVQPEVLKYQIADIRNTLGDRPKNSLFIETLPRRGYQFIAPVGEGPVAALPAAPSTGQTGLVGRDGPLGELAACLRTALSGWRQIVFVTGEPGIGKTALVDEFERRAAAGEPSLRAARGQCVEGYGGTEAYYPMLEALGQLCRGSGKDRAVQILAAHAPTWLVQFPALLTAEHRQALQREILGATRDRMLREIREALEILTSDAPLLLVFEDLQWVDPSTVDLISNLARGREPLKLLLIGTYRPADLASAKHPLRGVTRDLLAHQLCHEIPLEPLAEAEIAQYLSRGSTATALAQGLAKLVHRHTEGNPLFMVAALKDLAERGLVSRKAGNWQLEVPLENVELNVPENLRQMIEAQIDRLSVEEQRALEAASVAGARFSPDLIAAAAGLDLERFEDLCQEQSRLRRILRPAGSEPYYELVHALYREVLYQRQAPGRRAKLHLRIGERLETLFSGRLSDAATELAHHFEQGLDWPRAIRYLELGADTAGRRSAPQEAAAMLQHAFALLNKLPEAERAVVESRILDKLTTTYLVSSDPRAVETYQSLRVQAASYGLIDVEARALLDLAYPFSIVSAEHYLEVLERSLRLAAEQSDALMRARTRASCFLLRIWAVGWNAADADQCKRALAEIRQAADPMVLGAHLIDYGLIQCVSSDYRGALWGVTESLLILDDGSGGNPCLSLAYRKSRSILSWSLLFLGDLGTALKEIEGAISMLQKNGDRYRAQVLCLYKAWVYLFAMDFESVLSLCETAVPDTGDPAGVYPLRFPSVLRGYAETAFGNYDRALEHFQAAMEDMHRRRVVFDWYWRITLEAGLTELWIARGDIEQARTQADRFLEAALATAEHTWQALAWEANARVFRAELEYPQAQDCINNALSAIEGFEAPLAAWRVHATASELYDLAGNRAGAEQHRELSRAVIVRMADSLGENDVLRQKFLTSRPIHKVLAGAWREAAP